MISVEELRNLMIPKVLWKDMEKEARLGKDLIILKDGYCDRSFEEMITWIPYLESHGFFIETYVRDFRIRWSYKK